MNLDREVGYRNELFVEPSSEPHGLMFQVIGSRATRLPYDDVNRLYKDLGDWLIATRAKMPLRVGDTYDADRPVAEGTVMVSAGSRLAFIASRHSGVDWQVTGVGIVVPRGHSMLASARVIYVPEEEK